MQESCIAKHFQRYALLSPQDLGFLESLEEKPEFYPRNAKVWHEGSETTHFYILRSGWAYSSRILQNGSRQVLDLYVPGDMIGLREFACKHRLTAVHTVTDAELCPLPQSQLRAIFEKSALLGQLLFALAGQGQALLHERIINLGRRSARQRMAHLLSELWVRLEQSTAVNVRADSLPLSQTLLADLLGLSAVHTNRTLRSLREAGLIELQYQTIVLRDVDGLREVAGFNPAYLTDEFTTLLPENLPSAGAVRPGDGAEISFTPVDSAS